MKCIVVTPEKTILEREADLVVVPLYDGEYGIEKGHTPVVGRLGAGELRISSQSDREPFSMFVQGGFVEVLNDEITLLTGRAVSLDTLDLAKSEEALAAALAAPANSEELFKTKQDAVNAARAEVRIASKNVKA